MANNSEVAPQDFVEGLFAYAHETAARLKKLATLQETMEAHPEFFRRRDTEGKWQELRQTGMTELIFINECVSSVTDPICVTDPEGRTGVAQGIAAFDVAGGSFLVSVVTRGETGMPTLDNWHLPGITNPSVVTRAQAEQRLGLLGMSAGGWATK
jgi:hypothetical protein